MHHLLIVRSAETAMGSPHRRRSVDAFSLVEVTLAIGIIAFAFVALFGLLPTGMRTFRAAIDTSNESWILQNINSMVQTTDFAEIEKLGIDKGGKILYFDEEAKLTEVVRDRLYAVKLVTDKMHRPDGDSLASSANLTLHGLKVITVIAPFQDGNAMAEFDKVKDAVTLRALPKQVNVRSRTFFVARMDSQPL